MIWLRRNVCGQITSGQEFDRAGVSIQVGRQGKSKRMTDGGSKS